MQIELVRVRTGCGPLVEVLGAVAPFDIDVEPAFRLVADMNLLAQEEEAIVVVPAFQEIAVGGEARIVLVLVAQTDLSSDVPSGKGGILLPQPFVDDARTGGDGLRRGLGRRRFGGGNLLNQAAETEKWKKTLEKRP